MGNKLFGVDIAKELAAGFASAGGVRPLVLRKFTKGTATLGALTAGTNRTSAESAGQGFVETATERKGQTLVKNATAMVSILGGSLPDGVEPTTNDEVDLDGTTYTLLTAETDPAAAVFECQASS